jgi:hypothetical protein
MKNLLFIFSLCFLMLFSCSSGNDDNVSLEDENSLLMRAWYLVGVEDENGNSLDIIECENNGHRDYVEFISPNIANFYYVSSSSGNNCSDEYVIEPYTFIKNENEISLYYLDNLNDIWTITKLNGLSLEVTTNYGLKREYSAN